MRETEEPIWRAVVGEHGEPAWLCEECRQFFPANVNKFGHRMGGETHKCHA